MKQVNTTQKIFTDYDEKITTENNLIKKYGLLRENLVNLSKARILFDNRNTKIILQNNFDIDDNEELRYMAFISYIANIIQVIIYQIY